MIELMRDLRTGLRVLLHRPQLLVPATLTLGLGLGASTGVFSVVEAALLQPLPFRDADRLAVVWGVAGPEQDIRGASPVEIDDWDASVDALGPLSRYNETTVNATGPEGAEQLEAELVSPGFFRILGTAPVLGRAFRPEDDEAGAAGSAVISHALWQRRFGGSTEAVGQTLRLDDVAFTVVGVMPEGFSGLSFDTEIWVPLGPFVGPEALSDRGGRWLAAIGRLTPGATAAVAQSQLDVVASRLEEAYPDTNRDRGAMLQPLRDFYVGQSRSLLLMVLAGVGLLLLIACANVANLQLVRAVERRREVALRFALGAGRRSVARQLVAESLVLAAFGAAAGVALAWVGLQTLLPLVPDGVLPPYSSPGIDAGVLGFGLVAALVAGLLFALAPAMRAATEDPADALRGGTRNSTRGRTPAGRPVAQHSILVAQVALALVLLVAAGLAVRSLQAQLAVEPGFRADGILAARVSLIGDAYDRATRVDFARAVLAELDGLPGVDAAAMSAAPLRGYNSASYIFRAEDPISPDTRIRYYRHSVTPGAFAALGIPIVAGRGFSDADRSDAPGVAVVSQAFGAKVWPDEDALGQRVLIGPGDTATVIGVAGDVRQRDLTTDLMDPGEDPDVYFAYAQIPTGSMDLLARAADPGALAGAIRRTVARQDPGVAVYDVVTLADELARRTALARLISSLLVVFAVLAVAVAAVGLYGVLAFVVRGRRREIAIRAALGARPGVIRRLVVRQGLALVLLGLALGVGASLVLGRAAASVLFGVDDADPVVLGGTALLLLLVAVVASWIPAFQATRIDPHTAMAEE